MRVLHTREQESSCVGMYVQGLKCLNTAAGTNADALYCACLQIYSLNNILYFCSYTNRLSAGQLQGGLHCHVLWLHCLCAGVCGSSIQW